MERNTEKSNEKRRVGVRGLNSKGLETGQRRHIVLSYRVMITYFG